MVCFGTKYLEGIGKDVLLAHKPNMDVQGVGKCFNINCKFMATGDHFQKISLLFIPFCNSALQVEAWTGPSNGCNFAYFVGFSACRVEARPKSRVFILHCATTQNFTKLKILQLQQTTRSQHLQFSKLKPTRWIGTGRLSIEQTASIL